MVQKQPEVLFAYCNNSTKTSSAIIRNMVSTDTDLGLIWYLIHFSKLEKPDVTFKFIYIQI